MPKAKAPERVQYATVWAFQPLAETNYKTGFVQVERSVAEDLIRSGDAQDPLIGANHMKHIVTDDTGPKSKKKPKKAKQKTPPAEIKKVQEPELISDPVPEEETASAD